MKNKTSECVAIGKEESRYWESKNNLNVWMKTIQDKSKKTNKEIKMRELKKQWSKKKRRRKIQIGLMQFRNLKLLFTEVIFHPHPHVTFSLLRYSLIGFFFFFKGSLIDFLKL